MKFFKDNRPYLSTEFFECEDYKNLKAIDEKMVSKIVKKETNTLIRFIRTQDKFMETMKRDLMYKVNPSRGFKMEKKKDIFKIGDLVKVSPDLILLNEW